MEPALELGTLFDALLVLRLVVIRTVHLVELLLSDVLELECDLGDLAHVHATCRLA